MRQGEGPVVLLFIVIIIVLIGSFVIDTRNQAKVLVDTVDQQNEIIEQQKLVINGLSQYILTGRPPQQYIPPTNNDQPIH